MDNRIFTIEKDIYDLGERTGAFKNEIKTLKQRQEELRKKIDDPETETLIQTVRGIGYRVGA